MKNKLYNADIIVVGGGMAGVVSSISAATQGSKVILIEKDNCLGGTTTLSMLGEMNAVFFNGENYVSEVGTKIINNLFYQNAAVLNRNEPMSSNPDIKVDRIKYNSEYLKLILDKMVVEQNIEVFFNSYISDIEIINEKETKIILKSKYETIKVTGKILIDATGNAECVHMLKGSTIINSKEKNQPATLMFKLGGVDIKEFKKLDVDNLKRIILKGYDKGILPGKILSLSQIPGTSDIAVNATRSSYLNHESIEDISKALLETREQISKIVPFIIENIKGFENAYLSAIGANIGIRDRRRIDGLYELKGNDIISGKKFKDAVAIGNYPVDIHNNRTGSVDFKEISGDGIYTIPYRCLIPKRFNNVIVSGKCISADDIAFGSIRVIGPIMNVGEAVGTAANLAIKNELNLKEISISELQNILRHRRMKI